MIGRKAYSDPLFLSTLQLQYLCPVSGAAGPPDPEAVVRAMAEYADVQIAGGSRLHHITRHMLGLFNGRPGGASVAPLFERAGESGRCQLAGFARFFSGAERGGLINAI